MKVVICIPTYNEAENIGAMIDALKEQRDKVKGHDLHLLVVDANSPDGTAKIVSGKAKDNPWVTLLLEEKKEGIGAGYFKAFKYAIDKMQADAVMEMDADFQHDPNDVPRLVAELDNGYDYIIGSRYVKGGGIPKEWAFYRKFLSFGGSLFTKIVLGIYNIDDFTGGFKLSRVKGFVDKIDFSKVNSKSFAYKVDLLYKMYKLGAKIKQVPIVFGLRDRGNSKIENNTMIDTLKVVLLLRYEDNKHFFKFLAVGMLGLVTDTVLFNVFMASGILLPRNSAITSGGVAMLVTFTFNNLWSFKERSISDKRKMFQSFVVYVLSSSVPILARGKIVQWFVNALGNTFFVYNTGFMIGVILGLIWNFTVYNKLIWKKN